MKLSRVEMRRSFRMLFQAFWRRCSPAKTIPIVEWVQSNLRYDPASERQGLIELRPCQIEPLQAAEDRHVRQVTAMAGERGGKSLVWKCYLGKRIFDGGLYGLILYQSEAMAERTNANSVLPMLEGMKWSGEDLKSRKNKRKDAFFLPSCRSIVRFSGSAPALSDTYNAVAVDEIDYHVTGNDDADGQNVSSITSARKRMLTYRDTSKLIVCSSPTLFSGQVWKEYKNGSMGVWHLACLNCGELHPGNKLAFFVSAGVYAGLQWRKEDGIPIPESIRYICRKCGHQHVEADAPEMNRCGKYIHEADKKTEHRSFSWGALALPDVWYWKDIAQAQENAIDPEGHKFLHNTVYGWPQKPMREESYDDQKRALRAHIVDPYPPAAELTPQIAAIFAGIDQQQYGVGGDKYFVFVVRAYCDNGDSYLLAEGKADTLDDLRAQLGREWYGRRLFLAAFDHGGFDNNDDLEPFVASDPAFCFYKGAEASARQLAGAEIAVAESNPKLFWCNRVAMQVRLLDAIYGPPRAGGGYRWNLPATVSESYLDQVGNMHPSTNRLHGDDFNLWTHSKGQRIDYFDSEKMCVAAFEIAARFIRADRWPRGRFPVFRQQEIIREAIRKNPNLLKPKVDERNKVRG